MKRTIILGLWALILLILGGLITLEYGIYMKNLGKNKCAKLIDEYSRPVKTFDSFIADNENFLKSQWYNKIIIFIYPCKQ